MRRLSKKPITRRMFFSPGMNEREDGGVIRFAPFSDRIDREESQGIDFLGGSGDTIVNRLEQGRSGGARSINASRSCRTAATGCSLYAQGTSGPHLANLGPRERSLPSAN